MISPHAHAHSSSWIGSLQLQQGTAIGCLLRRTSEESALPMSEQGRSR
jgi:hypothetical protein